METSTFATWIGWQGVVFGVSAALVVALTVVRDVYVSRRKERQLREQREKDAVQLERGARAIAALEHIAAGNISPASGFAKRVLDGASVREAHRAEVAEWDEHRW